MFYSTGILVTRLATKLMGRPTTAEIIQLQDFLVNRHGSSCLLFKHFSIFERSAHIGVDFFDTEDVVVPQYLHEFLHLAFVESIY